MKILHIALECERCNSRDEYPFNPISTGYQCTNCMKFESIPVLENMTICYSCL